MKNPLMTERAPENVYLAGKREWNERYSGYIAAMNNWRLTALGSIAGNILLAGIVGALVLQQKVVPYAVEFNEHSEVVRVSRADVMAQPTSNQTRAALRTLVVGVRTVYADLRAQQKQIEDAYAMIAPDSPAYRTVASYHSENDPYKRAQTETVGIEVKTVVAITGQTWQVEWIETTKQLSGKVLEVKAMTGTFTVTNSAPTDERQILINPLGIYVKDLAWTTRL